MLQFKTNANFTVKSLLNIMSLVLVILSVFLFNLGTPYTFPTRSSPEYNLDFGLDTPQTIKRHGYKVETHIVQTIDGYLLSVHRIPSSKNGTAQPVFLQHGLLGSSSNFILIANNSLAYILSNLGYDVWIGNCRGNHYSRSHISLDPNTNPLFWDHSFQEMGEYDLPAVFDYIENKTNTLGEIIYVGHSMGTTMFFIYASTMPELAKKSVKAMVALSPIAFMNKLKTPMASIAKYELDWIVENLGIREFTPSAWELPLSMTCRSGNFEREVCKELDVFDLLLTHNPAGISTKTILHYTQEIHDSGNFQKYNFREEQNLIKYGTPEPPLYNVSNINVPVFMMYGDNAWLGILNNIERLESLIGKEHASLYKVGLKEFNHMDFIWARDARTLVYDELIKFIEKYKM